MRKALLLIFAIFALLAITVAAARPQRYKRQVRSHSISWGEILYARQWNRHLQRVGPEVWS